MIAFEDVHVRRGATPVLTGVTFTVAAGETFALVGRSGAGKSTALKLINGMLMPDRGRVEVGGRTTREWEPVTLRRRTGYILQEVGLFPHMSIAANVGMGLVLAGWDRPRLDQRVREMLQLVGLDPDRFGERWPDELSGGQRQRVGVARALAPEPPVVLMDEPFGALDPITRLELHREFRRIQTSLHKAIVLVTHDMREAFALADRVGVLDEGTLAACAPPRDLEASSHPAVQMLLEAAFATR